MHLGFGEISVVLVIALLVFGPSKLPQLGEALGKGIRNFKKAFDEEPTHVPPGEGRAAPVADGVRSAHPAFAENRVQERVVA
jgi:sec-independent protein translocase protein TatA